MATPTDKMFNLAKYRDGRRMEYSALRSKKLAGMDVAGVNAADTAVDAAQLKKQPLHKGLPFSDADTKPYGQEFAYSDDEDGYDF